MISRTKEFPRHILPVELTVLTMEEPGLCGPISNWSSEFQLSGSFGHLGPTIPVFHHPISLYEFYESKMGVLVLIPLKFLIAKFKLI